MNAPIKPPEMLLISAEKLFLDVTEPLDCFIALQLWSIVRGLISTAYAMGFADGRGASGVSICSEFSSQPENLEK
ncbi:hypothetical protein [Gloeobacter kilaueensis]|uniref:Uncharacterized protein n=1 Tax=Gloeobacter kilaueensis (strain ATCC BAA-2537 / CCAP 1431/1 / ULC 316 / JS1) TaxID=1183438 RepID=U5QK42_GLOK1|nr:hypothetical protein [Gloeobacter kilaueensis]AGY57984.1 hypothetical protein GKIL_1738 [Gloeobacter kilaueensis JS1]